MLVDWPRVDRGLFNACDISENAHAWPIAVYGDSQLLDVNTDANRAVEADEVGLRMRLYNRSIIPYKRVRIARHTVSHLLMTFLAEKSQVVMVGQSAGRDVQVNQGRKALCSVCLRHYSNNPTIPYE